MNHVRRLATLSALAAAWLQAATQAGTATWDGGNGAWTDAKWNGGQDAATVFGSDDGVNYDAALANEFVIGGGAQVLYLGGPGGVDSDFRLNSSTNGGGPTAGVIKEAAVLELRTEEAADGVWTEWDGDLTLDGGSLKRTFQAGGTANTSGAHMFGSWNTGELVNHEIDVALANGGRFENHGALMFGAWNESGKGLKVTLTINDGSIDLTGGDAFVLNDVEEQNADLHFYFGTAGIDGDPLNPPTPKNESYVINFTGPGSITVDRAGIRLHRIGVEYSTWVDEPKTYEQLWDLGILRADGQSGLTGANFGTYFNVSGALGGDDYRLTSRVAGGLAGDFNGDATIDGADFLLWQRGGSPSPLSPADLSAWKANFGAGATGPSALAVPEPATLVAGLIAASVMLRRRRRSRQE